MAIIDRFPSIFPRGKVRVDEEEHTYRVFDTESGPNPKQQYTLEKSPIEKVESLRAVVNNNTQELTEGVDYELTPGKEQIDFSIGGDSPDAGTTFTVTYIAQSVISRYTGSYDDEVDRVERNLDDIREGKFIEQATGQQLDELGALFGELGKRRGRGDQQYRIFLKSIVQSFAGRGTVDGIKFAVSSGLGIDEDRVIITEDFQNNSYTIEVDNFQTPFSTAVVTTLAELADPSGVNLKGPLQITLDDAVIVFQSSSAEVMQVSLSDDGFLNIVGADTTLMVPSVSGLGEFRTIYEETRQQLLATVGLSAGYLSDGYLPGSSIDETGSGLGSGQLGDGTLGAEAPSSGLGSSSLGNGTLG